MNPEDQILEIENWIDEVLNVVQEMIEAGQPLPDELYAQVADAIEQEQSKIQQLMGQSANLQEGVNQTSKPSEETRLLWILSGSNPEAFVNYLRTYPGDEFQQLLRNPTRLQQTINQLQSNPSLQSLQGREQDGIPKSELQSSNVYGIKYNPKNGKMLVRFQKGSVYEYDQVPPYIFNAFRNGAAPARTKGKNQFGQWWKGKTPSLGAALNAYIKEAGYNYRRIR